MKPNSIPRLIVDTREQTPFVFEGYETMRAPLKSGDYSLEGYGHRIAVERKNHSDAWGCLTAGRQRFERCMERLGQLERAMVVIESPQREFVVPPRQVQRVNAATAMGSYISWMCKYRVPVVWCENRFWAERVTLRFLLAFLKHVEGDINGRNHD